MIEMTEQPQELQERFKKFTILHSNDMHGDFLAESKGAEGNLIGGEQKTEFLVKVIISR